MVVTDIVHTPGWVIVASGVCTPDTVRKIGLKSILIELYLLTRQPYYCLQKPPS